MNIVITGASRGLGRAIAEAFAQDKQGHTLVLTARNKEHLESFCRELQGRFPRTRILSHAADLADKEATIALGQWVLQRVPQVDILVNNAGSFVPGNVGTEPDGALETMMAVNLYSAYHLTRTLLPAMKGAGSGHIFNMCSIASIKAYPNGGAYSISKYALLGFSKNLREELKDQGIKVTAVMPGAVYTDSWADTDVPQSRIMEAKDIALLVYHAAHLSPQATVEEIIVRPQLGDL
jgi:short-subunit dehydrogenase